MSKNFFFPYAFADSALNIKLYSFEFDGVKRELEFLDENNRSVNLTSLNENWESVTFSVEATDPNNQLLQTIADKNYLDDIDIWIVIYNKFTRIRRAERLKKDKDRWHGVISFFRRDITKTTELECYASLTKDIGDHSGFAKFKHERLANAPSWKIYTDTIPIVPGGSLNSRWLNFSESNRTDLQKRKDCVWYLDLSDDLSPELILNEGVPKLRQTLEVESKTSKAARVRDALIHSILQSVINELSVYALTNSINGDGLDDLPDWQRKMLLTLARYQKDASDVTIVNEWLNSWKDSNPSQVAHVLTDIATAIQRHLNLFNSSQYLVSSAEVETQNA